MRLSSMNKSHSSEFSSSNRKEMKVKTLTKSTQTQTPWKVWFIVNLKMEKIKMNSKWLTITFKADTLQMTKCLIFTRSPQERWQSFKALISLGTATSTKMSSKSLLKNKKVIILSTWEKTLRMQAKSYWQSLSLFSKEMRWPVTSCFTISWAKSTREALKAWQWAI